MLRTGRAEHWLPDMLIIYLICTAAPRAKHSLGLILDAHLAPSPLLAKVCWPEEYQVGNALAAVQQLVWHALVVLDQVIPVIPLTMA